MPNKYQSENKKAAKARAQKAVRVAAALAKRQKSLDIKYRGCDDEKMNTKADLTSYVEAPTKLTPYQIQLHRDTEKAGNLRRPLLWPHLDMPLIENLNRNIGEVVDGSGIDGALRAMSGDATPKMSQGAAFAAFKNEKLPLLKQENPKLKFSQLNDQIRKEWKRSPANPLNQI